MKRALGRICLLVCLSCCAAELLADDQTGREDFKRSADVSSSPESVTAGISLDPAESAHSILDSQILFLEQLLDFGKPITVRTEVNDGPLFDPDTQEIWIPDSFAQQIEQYFENTSPVADVYFHTLMHEVGHALFDQYQIPLLAREEDAADALANVLLLEYVDDGAQIALNAAEMFGLESDSYEWYDFSDFSGEHSLEIQRYYATLCHVYGHEPEAHADLVNDEYGLSQERADACEYEYERLRQSWMSILRPYLKW